MNTIDVILNILGIVVSACIAVYVVRLEQKSSQATQVKTETTNFIMTSVKEINYLLDTFNDSFHSLAVAFDLHPDPKKYYEDYELVSGWVYPSIVTTETYDEIVLTGIKIKRIINAVNFQKYYFVENGKSYQIIDSIVDNLSSTVMSELLSFENSLRMISIHGDYTEDRIHSIFGSGTENDPNLFPSIIFNDRVVYKYVQKLHQSKIK